METSYKEIAQNGLWNNNIGLVQLLGLCPLMAVTTSTVNALGLGMATVLTLLISNTLISLVRDRLRPEIRLPVFVLLIAATVTVIQLWMSAYFYQLYLALGVFVGLIVTNCGIIGRAEAFASRQPVAKAALDGFFMGLGFALVLLVVGMIRELLGQGTLFANLDLLFGAQAKTSMITFFENYQGLLLAVLPPGAFMTLALLIALKNRLARLRLQRRQPQIAATPLATAVTNQ
jgi:electron transport complex protein RnfE